MQDGIPSIESRPEKQTCQIGICEDNGYFETRRTEATVIFHTVSRVVYK